MSRPGMVTDDLRLFESCTDGSRDVTANLDRLRVIFHVTSQPADPTLGRKCLGSRFAEICN